MGITHLGPDVPSMYSTPSMIQLIEGACVRLIARYVEPGEQPAGYRSTCGIWRRRWSASG
jgi:predicted thioesterase